MTRGFPNTDAVMAVDGETDDDDDGSICATDMDDGDIASEGNPPIAALVNGGTGDATGDDGDDGT